MLLSPAMLPHLNAAFRKSSTGTTDTESDQPPTTSGNIQKRIQYGLVSNLSGSGLSAATNPGDTTNAVDADNNGTVDQTDLIEAITFASLYGFQAVPIRIKILLHRALSTLTRKRAEAIIRRTGWKIDDFERGFIQEGPLIIAVDAFCDAGNAAAIYVLSGPVMTDLHGRTL